MALQSCDAIRIDQRRLFRLMALGGVLRVAAGIDDGHEQRAGDGGDRVRPGAGQVGVVERNGLAQIGQGIDRREFRVSRVAGLGVAVVRADGHAAAKARIKPDGAFAAGQIGEGFALGQAIGDQGRSGAPSGA